MVAQAEKVEKAVQVEKVEIVDKNIVLAVLTTNTNTLKVEAIEVVFENH